MKTIANDSDYQIIVNRIRKIKIDSHRQWGQMTAHQMICHLCDPLKIALGTKSATDRSSFMLRNVVKSLVLWGLPTPRGKVKTVPEMNVQKGGGTQPIHFEADVENLLKLLQALKEKKASDSLQSHPAFGAMDYAEWCRLSYVHIDHHLQQFGV
jgi:Protein of unknown function (DUF1569)